MTGVTSCKVNGDWRVLVDDTPTDPDPYPDEQAPAGHVRFVPTDPGPHLSGGIAYTLAPATALIAAGRLTDLQGRDGVHLAATVGDTQIQWTAHITYGGHRDRVTFSLTDDLHLTDLLGGYR